MPTKKLRITTNVTQEEYSAIQATANKAGMSLSRCIKQLSLGQPVKSIEHQAERREMRKISADLGRLGGLLKQALANGADKLEIYPLLKRVDQLLEEMKQVIQVLK